MKKRPLLFLSSTVLILALAAYLAPKEQAYEPRNNQVETTYADGAAAYLHALRANPKTGEFDARLYAEIADAERNYRLEKSTSSLGLEWTEMGPDNIGGRTRALLYVNPELIL